jgi:hypothetical protein
MIARRSTATASAAVAAVVAVAVAASAWAETSGQVKQSRERPLGVVADCAKGPWTPQGSLSVFGGRGTLVVGPLAMVGAAVTPGYYSESFHGNKFPLYLKAGHRVTLALTPGTRGRAGLAYGPLPEGDVRVPDAHRVITLIACRRGEYSPGRGGPAGRVSFWAGGVVALAPRCVPLLIWVDDEPSPRRAVIHLGVTDCG